MKNQLIIILFLSNFLAYCKVFIVPLASTPSGIKATMKSDVPAIILFLAKKYFILNGLLYLDDGSGQYKL